MARRDDYTTDLAGAATAEQHRAHRTGTSAHARAAEMGVTAADVPDVSVDYCMCADQTKCWVHQWQAELREGWGR